MKYRPKFDDSHGNITVKWERQNSYVRSTSTQMSNESNSYEFYSRDWRRSDHNIMIRGISRIYLYTLDVRAL